MKRAPGAGRPRRGDGLADRRVMLRLTSSEYVRVERAAEEAGQPVATWCARACVDASGQGPKYLLSVENGITVIRPIWAGPNVPAPPDWAWFPAQRVPVEDDP